MTARGRANPTGLVCPVARSNRDAHDRVPPGHLKKTRTGRSRPYYGWCDPGPRTLKREHEYVCECGYRGFSAIELVLGFPMDVKLAVTPIMLEQLEKLAVSKKAMFGSRLGDGPSEVIWNHARALCDLGLAVRSMHAHPVQKVDRWAYAITDEGWRVLSEMVSAS